MTTSTTETPGRDWLEMRPAHFDASLLPRKHRKPEAEGLFSVADIAPAAPKTAPKQGQEMEGQEGLFPL